MKWLKQTIVALFCITLMVSCEYEFIEIATPEPPDPNDTTVDTVYFAAQIEPLFSSNGCTDCHKSGNFFNLTAGNAYKSIMDNDAVNLDDPPSSLIYTKPLPTGSHFKKYASTDEANLVLTWIYQGALDN